MTQHTEPIPVQHWLGNQGSGRIGDCSFHTYSVGAGPLGWG
jgi:hypothetical protein